MTDIDHLTASAYASGGTPIEVAERRIVTLLEARAVVEHRAVHDLPPLPAWPDATFATVARKILGLLLDAGWQQPSDETVRASIEHVRAAGARHDAWWVTLTAQDQARFMEHYSRTGEPPADLRPPS